ncbi:MAG: N-acetyltransferase [Desulfovibrionales bacterium]
MNLDLYLRKAKIQDVKRIHFLLMECSKQGLLLPRSYNELYSHLRDYFVVADRATSTVYGCCALSIAWEDLAEIRSLVVDPSIRGNRWGSRLVEACLSDAMTIGLYKVFVLTYQVDFFSSVDFGIVSKDILPQKVWSDCLRCPKFPECDETAMLIEL